MERILQKKIVALSIIILFFGTCITPQISLNPDTNKNGVVTAAGSNDDSCHCSEKETTLVEQKNLNSQSPSSPNNGKNNPSRSCSVFTNFQVVPEADNSDHITYTIDLGATYGDTIICHLMTEVTTTTINLADNISFLIFSTTSSPNQIYERYACGNKSVQDVGRLHDSIYFTTLVAELDTLEITLHAQDSYPHIIYAGSYVEIQASNPSQSWGYEHGDWSLYPGIYTDPTVSGYSTQPWVFAHGYHASWKEFVEVDEFLRAYSEVAAFSYKEFSPIETDENRRANIFIRTTWAGSMDVNSVSPTGASMYGYIVGAGLARGAPPPAGITKWTRLAEGGDLVDVLGPSLSYIEEVVNIVAVSVLDEAIEQSLGVPFVGSIIDVIEFYDMLMNVTENTSGAKTIYMQNVKLNQHASNYIWAGVYTRAQAAGTATAYVNFRYDGDPFLEGAYDNHNKGVWLHNALIYYAPVEFPHIQINKPVEDYTLIAQNDTISFSATVTKGDGPYTYEWFEERRDENRNITSTVLSSTTDVSSTATTFSTSNLAPGKCTIVVKVTDEQGGSCTDLRCVEILAPPGKPTITMSQSSINEFSQYLVQWNTVDRIAYYVLQESTNSVTWYNYPSQTWLWRPFLKTTPLITYYYRVVPYNKLDRFGPVSNVVSINIKAKPLDATLIKDLPIRNGSDQVYGFHWKKYTTGIDYGYHLKEYQWVNLTAADIPRIEKKLINEIYWDETTILDLTDHVMYQNQTDGSWWFGYSFSHEVTEPTVYEYEISGRRKIGENYYDGNWSRNVSIEILPPPKYAPTMMQPTFNASRCVPYYIEWTYNTSDIHEYYIEEATDSSFTQNVEHYSTNQSKHNRAFEHTPTSTTTYYYHVRGKNIGGNGPWSNIVTKKVYGNSGVPKPGTPILQASTLETHSGEIYSFTWNRIDPEGQYRFQEATDSGFDPEDLVVDKFFGGCGVIPYTNWSTTHNTTFTRTYYYRIQALAAYAENGDWSDTVEVIVYGNKTQPAPLLHDPGTTIERYRAYTISWEPVNSLTSIELHEATDPLFTTVPSAWDVSGSRTDLYEELWQAPLETTTYYYRMRVRDTTGGVSPWSNIVDIQVLYPNCFQVGWNMPQGRPTLNTRINGTIVNSDLPLTINWTRVPGATFYIVEEAEFYPDTDLVPPRCQWERSSWQVFNGNGTEVILNRQGDANKILCYRVIAGNYCGLTLPSNVSTITLLKGYIPSAPTNESNSDKDALSLFIGVDSFPGRQILASRINSATFNNILSTGGAQISVHDSQGTVYQSDHGIGNVIGASIGYYGFSTNYKIAKVENSTTVKVYNAIGTLNRTISGLKGVMGVCFGDLDGTGGVDLAISEYNMSNVTIYNRLGAKIQTIMGLAGPCGMAIGDFNNDGSKDIAIAQERLGKVTVFNKTGSVIQELTDLVRPQSVTLQDENHDGIQDIVIGTADGKVHVYFGLIDHRTGWDCKSVYDPYDTIPSGQCLYRPVPDVSYSDFCDITQQATLVKLIGLGTSIGDFNNDGSNELALIYTTQKVRVYTNSSSSWISQSYDIPGIKDVAIGDFDNDQINEVAVSTPSVVKVYETTNWDSPIADIPTSDARGVYIGDFNDDGLKELAVTQNNRVSIYGPGPSHPLIKEITGFTNPEGIQIFDFNNDGFNDIAVFDNYTGGAFEIKVFMQQNRPTRPTVISPLHDAINVAISEDLNWACSDPDSGDSITYDIYLGTDPKPPLVTSQYTSSSFDPGTLSYDTTYYWQIVAHDTHGLVTPGPIWKFSTKTNSAPTLPSYPTPTSGLTNVSVFVNLSWSCSDVDSEDTVTYDVYLGTNPTQLTKLSTQQTRLYYIPQNLNYTTTYYWMIFAHDTNGHVVSGPIWSFTTEYTLARGFWHLDEGTGATAYDASTYHNDGSITGATWTTGKYGNALYFHGGGQWHDGDVVTIQHDSSLDFTQPFIIEAWVNATGTDNYLVIADKLLSSTTSGFTLYINDGVLRLSIYSGPHGIKDLWGTSQLRDNNWHHIAGMWTGNQVRIYVDGKIEAQDTWIYAPVSNTQPLGIGKRISGVGGYLPFLGKIDEVRISTWKQAPTKPYNHSPTNNSINIELNPLLQVTVNDADKDIVNAIWCTNRTGTWEPFAANYSIDTTNPVTIRQHNPAFSQYLTNYWWKVLVTDTVYESSSIFNFKTLADTTKPEITEIIATPALQIPNSGVNITCNAFDLSGIQTVKVDITPPTGPPTNQTMISVPGSAQFYYNTTYTTQGIYFYKIWAQDKNSNSKTSSQYNFSIGYFINLRDFPMYTAQTPFNEMCGPAVAQMTLNYMWWNSSQDPTPPMLFDNQQGLYDVGHFNNTNQTIPYLDTNGLWKLLQTYRPLPYTTYGYNFNKYSNTDSTYMLKQICEWINYTIGTYGGYKPGHPTNVPALIPAYGDYSNWMAVRGIRTDRYCFPLPSELTIYGFWVNDPMPGGIGENSYKTIPTWLDNYYQPLTSNDVYNGKYVAICEPPETRQNTKINIPPTTAQFNDEQQNLIQLTQKNNGKITKEIEEQTTQWIIHAAITGVTEQLIPYDTEFASLFQQTKPGTPFFIQSLTGENYYAVPFNIPIKIEKTQRYNPHNILSQTAIVILIDADDGSFKEASWTQTPMKYLPISQNEAHKIIINYCEEQGIELKDPTTIKFDLVYRQASPYYPDWRIVIEEIGYELYITQNGIITE